MAAWGPARCTASVACAPTDATVEFAAPADAAELPPSAPPAGPAAPAEPSAFARLLEGPLRTLDASVSSAEAALRGLAAGRPVELHALMIEVERARLGVQTFVQVRNRLVESYQDLMRMQL